MTSQAQDLGTAIPDLRALPLELVDEQGGAVLAQAIELYCKRINEGGVTLSSFNSGI
jgi:hypothetical protein